MTGPYPPAPGAPGPDPTGSPATGGGYPPYGSVPGQPQYGQPSPPPYEPPAQPTYEPPTQPAYEQPTQPQYGQPAQPQYGQPQYGQPAQPQYGQPQYGQPQYGQPQYGQPAQPQYGQPQYGQPQYGQPQYPQPEYAQQASAPPYPAYGDPAQFPGAYAPPPAEPPKSGGKALKILGQVGAFIVVALIIFLVRNGLPDFLDKGSSNPTQAVPSGISATSTAKAAPTAPFEDTKAAEYPEGEAGITLPAATAVTGFSKTQVAAALAKVKQGLIAGRLDPKMLVSHDNSTLLGLLAPDAKDGIKKDFTDKTFFVYATQIAAGHTLTNDKVRVSGRVTFRAAKNDDIRMLEVITNFVWVYPFTGPLKEAGDHLVVVHDEITWAFPVDADVEKSSRGMWIYKANGFASNMDCDLLDVSQLGLGKPQILAPGEKQDEDAPFDPNGTLDIKDTC